MWTPSAPLPLAGHSWPNVTSRTPAGWGQLERWGGVAERCLKLGKHRRRCGAWRGEQYYCEGPTRDPSHDLGERGGTVAPNSHGLAWGQQVALPEAGWVRV
jgi:hypothetical protein